MHVDGRPGFMYGSGPYGSAGLRGSHSPGTIHLVLAAVSKVQKAWAFAEEQISDFEFHGSGKPVHDSTLRTAEPSVTHTAPGF